MVIEDSMKKGFIDVDDRLSGTICGFHLLTLQKCLLQTIVVIIFLFFWQEKLNIASLPNYERKQIKFWFQNCQEKHNVIESPWTRLVISTQLRENPRLQAKVAVAAPKRTTVTGLKGVTAFHNLYDVFAQLDNLC